MKLFPLLGGLLVGALAPLSLGQTEEVHPPQVRRIAPATNVRPRTPVNQARAYSRGQNFRPANPGAAASSRIYRGRGVTNYNSNPSSRAWAGRAAGIQRRDYRSGTASDSAAFGRSGVNVGNRRGAAGNGNNYQGRGAGQNAGANIAANAWRRDGHRNWDRQRRDRNWWRSHYSRFALFGGGYYYWNSGYWYPAYGYDPYFSTYSYDAPIYAYNDLDPGQIIANVQVELQRRGYDPGSVDGDYGPATRSALLDYQQDNGLEVTGEIDGATLESLGLQQGSGDE